MYPLVSQLAVALDGAPAFIAIICTLSIILFVLLAPWFIIAALLRKRAERILQTYNGTVITQYDPPYNFSPAEIGLLYDMRCNRKEIRATLCHLAQRGIVTLDQGGSVTLTDKTAFESLDEYEQVAIRMYDKQTRAIGKTRTEQVTIRGLDGNVYPVTMVIQPGKSEAEFTEAVQRSLAKKGYRTKSYRSSFILRMLLISFIMWTWPFFTFAASDGTFNGQPSPAWSPEAFVGGVMAAFIFGIFLWPVYLFVSAILLGLWVKITGRSWLNTRQIRRIWPELEGYRLFLKTVDLDNIQFEATTTPTDITAKTLPYAIVFNLDTKWEQRLKR